jgi:7-carboxy-7-deazaguanine synthase
MEREPNFVCAPAAVNPVSGKAGYITWTQMFRTIQGEGPFCGSPTIFLRLLKCNRHCVWCDTEPQNKKTAVTEPIAQVAEKILAWPESDVCITGGEPLLQVNEVCELAQILRRAGRFVTLETNGELLTDDFEWGSFTAVVVSPKFPSAGFYVDPNLEHNVTRTASALNGHLKFVIGSRDDYDYLMRKVMPFVHRGAAIYLQPADPQFTFAQLYDLWVERPFRNAVIRPQIHKMVNMP